MIYTIGHSNLSADAFLERLRAWDVELLVDVRRFPSSRRHPHFNRPALADFLGGQGIRYLHEVGLGGHREARPDSPHTALEKGFRGYADHMSSRAFQESLARFLERGRDHVATVMCAEADPSRCHRRFLADALVVRGVEVVHILDAGESRPHELHPAARRAGGGELVYPDPSPRQLELFGPR